MPRQGLCILAILACACARGAEAPLPGGEVVEESPRPPEIPERIRLNSIFKIADGERMWEEGCRIGMQPVEALGEPVRMAGLLPSQFEYTRGFRLESYAGEAEIRQTVFVLSAEEARSAKSRILLDKVIISFEMSDESPLAVLAPGKRPATAAPAAAPSPEAPRKGRLVIRASRGVFDTEKGTGEASGGVTISIHSSTDPDPLVPMGVLASDKLRLRMWRNPTLGTAELGMYVLADDPAKPDPKITGRFIEHKPDGSVSKMDVEADGMIFEHSVYDHLAPLHADGKQVGVSNVRLRRAIFHKNIRMITEGSSSATLMPFQQAPAEGAEPKTPPPAEPTRTTVLCAGPCIMNFAAIPRKADPAEAEKPILFAQQFVFMNGVKMSSEPLEPPPGAPKAAPVAAPAAAGPSLQRGQLTCRHLLLQYPPAPPAGQAAPPSAGPASKLPEYAEALGGVNIRGTKAPTPGAVATAPVKPFSIDCQRVYYDSLADMINLEGLPGTPVEMVDEIGELRAQLCSVVRKTGVISMPLHGKKEMRVRPDALASLSSAPATPPTAKPPAAKPPATPQGFLEVSCFGPFTREVKEIIVAPGEPPLVKNILTMEKDVSIYHPSMGLKVAGQSVRTILDGKTLQPERLDARGAVQSELQGLRAEGETLSIDLAYKADGTPSKREVHVQGNRAKGQDAYLFQASTAIRSQTFVIDGITNSLWASNGAVLGVAMPPPPADPSKSPPAAGSIPGLGFGAGGKMTMQCDGDLHYDGSSGVMKAAKNVIVRQEGMQIMADALSLSLETTPPAGAKPAPEASGSMLGGGLKSVTCQGLVEIKTPTQVVHCDQLFYDLAQDRAYLETQNPNDDVRIYMQEPTGGTKVLECRHRLDFDGKTGMYAPETFMRMVPFKGLTPLRRQPAAGGRTP